MEYTPGIALLAAYLLGSVPVGVLAGRGWAGVDPRDAGSKNIGFTNVLRVAGKIPGVLTLLGDMGKGALAVIVSRTVAGQGEWDLASGAAAILGHLYPVFLLFKGGKGVATALGVLLALDVAIGAILLIIWLGSAAIWRISSLAALIAFGVLPGVMWVFHPDPAWMAFALGVSLLIGYRHIGNLRRLLAGTEPRFGMR
jgi:glycerol-3-phosphate acyltransferase PlsY